MPRYAFITFFVWTKAEDSYYAGINEAQLTVIKNFSVQKKISKNNLMDLTRIGGEKSCPMNQMSSHLTAWSR